MGEAGYGCLDPSGGILLADKALRAIQDLAVKFGAKIQDGVEVEEIRRDQEDSGLVSLRARDGKAAYNSRPTLSEAYNTSLEAKSLEANLARGRRCLRPTLLEVNLDQGRPCSKPTSITIDRPQ